MNLEALHLARPELVPAIWAWLALAALLVVLEHRGTDQLHRLVAPTLASRLVERAAPWRRGLELALRALAGLLMVVALIRPQWGERFVATPRVGAEIMIALDVSRSMLADDAKPSRLERAKAEISDLLAYLRDDQVGLIAFAGRASVLSPMTPDKSFLRLALDGAGPHSVSRGGTRLAEPILRAVAGLGEPGPAQRALLLITDGEDHDSFALDAAKKAAEAGIKIITIGFGDEAGSEIYLRDPNDGSRTLLRDADGKPVVSRLDGELLREIALVTDGAYVPAGTGVLDLASIYETHIARLTRGQLDARGRSIRGETYQTFVAAALACLVMGALVAGGRARRDDEARSASTPADSAERSRLRATGAALLAVAALAGLVVAIGRPARAADDEAADGENAAIEGPAPAPGAAAPPTAPPAPAAEVSETADAAEGVETGGAAAGPAHEDPRTRFNRANHDLAEGDPALASALYREARRDAVDDVELRYAASYNLGMAAVAQADAVEATNPEEALAHLHEAADWFREAAAMQPGESDPRHNLDVTLRRALILADAIARKSRKDVEGELDALIEAQRQRGGEVALLLEAVTRQGELAAADALRPAFDAAATAQRELLADGEALAERMADEKAALDAKPEDGRTPQEALRSASLEDALAHLDQGLERMGQTRRQLRQRSAERAYRRGAEALDALKRARDQLRDPVEQIGVLLAEVTGVGRATSALAAATVGSPPAGSASAPGAASSPPARLPAFLTPDAMEAETAAVEARVGELASRLATAAASDAGAAGGAPPGSASSSAGAPSGPASTAAAALHAALAEAAPLVGDAHAAMGRAAKSVGASRFEEAVAADGEAAVLLAEAQERFFDLRELLAVTHETEVRIATVARGGSPETLALRASSAAALEALQERNQSRVSRLEELLESERTAQRAALESGAAPVPAGEESAPPAPPDPARLEALERRFDRADALRAEAASAMAAAKSSFAGRAPGGEPDWSGVGEATRRAADRLDALRQLFLSLVEQLERLERAQTDLADRTRDAIALAARDAPSGTPPTSRGPETRARIEAAGAEQKGLEAQAGAVADELLARSEAAAAPGAGAEAGADGGAGANGGSEPDRDTLRRAADHVATSQLAMQEAVETFADEARPLAPASQAQDVAREELRKAIEILAPPPPEKPPEPPKEEPGSGEEASSGSEQGESEQEQGKAPDEPEQGGDEGASASEDQRDESLGSQDPAQLLQGVRDREAERREANERRARAQRRSAPVEKDW